jgi:hypothetical protein
MWICGDVSVNYHTLSDFRRNTELLDDLLTRTVAALMEGGLAEMQQVAQDGTRIKASANPKSFRRRPTLREHAKAAHDQVERLKQELETDPSAGSKRERAARQRAAKERVEGIERAIEAANEISKKRATNKSKRAARGSETDPDARVMKFAETGFKPGYNCQFAVDTRDQIIVGAAVTNVGSDKGELEPMLEQLEERYDRRPTQVLVDGGYTSNDDVVSATQSGVEVIMPPRHPANPSRGRYEPVHRDPPEVAEWRRRMGTTIAQEAYRRRAPTVECVNAITKNRGMGTLLVRGLEKVRAVVLLHAIAHNLGRAMKLGSAIVAT